jgi:3-oxoacyl-[acyl-carrier protein] reductase
MSKCALVTGSSRGIGEAIALRLAEDGFDIAINCRSNEEMANRVRDKIRNLGRKAEVFVGDVSNEQDCEQITKKVLQEFGNIAVLVNNAGITKDGLLMRMSARQFDDVIAANLRSAFLMIRFSVPSMVKARGGRIINLSSIAGIQGNAGQANYAASKAGIIGLTKSVAKELGSRNITCNAIAPGFIATEMTEVLGEEAQKSVSEQTALRRVGQVQDVAGAVSFLAGPDSSFITGQVLGVDGGLTL